MLERSNKLHLVVFRDRKIPCEDFSYLELGGCQEPLADYCSGSLTDHALLRAESRKTTRFRFRERSYRAGVITLEIIIALGIFALAFSALVIASFGTQATTLSSELESDALSKTSNLIEVVRANSLVSTSSIDGIFTTNVFVNTITPCKKFIDATTTWNGEVNRSAFVELKTIVTDLSAFASLGGDCGSSEPGSGWNNPLISTPVSVAGAIATSSMDVLRNFLYTSSINALKDFYIYNLGDGSTYSSKIGKDGLNSLDAAYFGSSGKTYVFAANASTTEQLKIIDVTEPSNLQTVSSTLSLTTPGSTNSVGKSIYYYGDRVYLGTDFTSTGPPELHIFDVLNKTSPTEVACRKVYASVKAITARNNFVYLGTSDDSPELKIYDISSLGCSKTLVLPDGYFDTPGTEDVLSLYLLGTKLYLGRAKGSANEPEFYILDVSDPLNPQLLGSSAKNPIGSDVTGIYVIGDYAYLSTSGLSALRIWNVADPYNPFPVSAPTNQKSGAVGVDYENNKVYLLLKGASTGSIKMIVPQP